MRRCQKCQRTAEKVSKARSRFQEKIFTGTRHEHTKRSIVRFCQSEGVTSVPAVFCVCTRPTFSYSVTWQCRWPSLNLAARSWLLWNPVQKSTVTTVETNCWWIGLLPVIRRIADEREHPASLNRTMHRQTSSGAVSWWNYGIHCSWHVADQQTGPQAGWLPHLGSDAGTNLPVTTHHRKTWAVDHYAC